MAEVSGKAGSEQIAHMSEADLAELEDLLRFPVPTNTQKRRREQLTQQLLSAYRKEAMYVAAAQRTLQDALTQ